MKPDDVRVDLIEELAAAFAAAGKAAMPAGRREEVVGLLTRLVVNPELREAYCRAVTAGRERLGIDRRVLESGDSGDIPDREIARNGFGGLTDDQLADYALCPSAIEAIAQRLEDDDLLPELGHWFIQAGKREVPEDPHELERTREMLRKLGLLK